MTSVSHKEVETADAPERMINGVSVRHFFGYLCMVVGMFMAILDIQIVASSLSEIQAGLAASRDEISWVQTAYLIAEVIMIPLTGFLSRLLSTRLTVAIAATGFTFFSVMCATAGSIEEMIVWRSLQGFIGGAMIPTVFATSFILFPGDKRNSMVALIGLIATLAPTIGPTLGGYLTENLSWHWIFLINLIPGPIVIFGTWYLIDIDKPHLALLKGFDYIGLVAMAVFLGCFEYILEEGTANDWLNDPVLAVLAFVSAGAGIFFIYRSLTHDNPVVDLYAFQHRNFMLGTVFGFILGVGLYGWTYIMPLYLARVRHLNSLQIGEIMFVTGAFQIFSAPLAAFLSKKMDPRLMMAIGFSLFAAAVLLSASMTADWGFSELLLPQACRGIALMLCMMPINNLALGTLPPDRLKNASGLYNLFRNLGGAFGLAIINTILSNRQQVHWNQLASAAAPHNPAFLATVDHLTSIYEQQSRADPQMLAFSKIGELIGRESTIMAFNDCLNQIGALFILFALMIPLLKKPATTHSEAAE